MTDISHCTETIKKIVEQGRDDRRAILQLGFNLGRLSELTGGGREPFWDRWKEPVTEWNLEKMRALAQELPDFPPRD